ncbi:MAG: NAD(+)/NADH kinase [Nitrososphaerota archaeon]|nr:NAD(+)/NADH kinase [Nitrososphaerota archaeon]
MKISKIGIISKEGDTVARDWAKKTAKLLLGRGLSVTSFPNLRITGVDHVRSEDQLGRSKTSLIIAFSGDGTILRLFRSLNSTIPCLCVNVGGRGILAETKPSHFEKYVDRIVEGDFTIEKRLRISPSIGKKTLPPALNEVVLVRQSYSKTPSFTIDLGSNAVFNQRMDGLIVTTPTGSTGHSFSYGSPFIQGTLEAFTLTPLAPIYRFPPIIIAPTTIRVVSDYALQLVVDGQETFRVEKEERVRFMKHNRDAVFVRLEKAGAYRQLSNLISLEDNTNGKKRKV